METIKNFLKTIDIFGTIFAFRYRDKERYQTIAGGFIVLLFLILAITFGIYYFVPFINKKNYTIVYYTMNLAVTEEVNLFQSESNFAVGIDCETVKQEKLQASDILDFSSNYILYVKSSDGTYEKIPKILATHKCTYEDFYNKYDSQVDYLGLSKYECLEQKGDTVQGIYADQIFSYFEFTVSAKNDSVLGEIDRFLYENDCKFQIVYTDVIIDIDNYEKPMTQFLDSMFIQLNPTLFIKRNMYFMNQYFSDDDYLFFVFGDEIPELKALYSSYEEYSLYMGLNRITTQPKNYNIYAKIYIRAALKRTIINRRYQKIMEFYADASSILVALYEVLNIIFNFIDNFYAYHSLSRQIFFFKGIEEKNNFNIFKRGKQIQAIISLIDYKDKKSSIIEYNSKIANKNNKGELESSKELNSDTNHIGIKIYKNKNEKLEIKAKKNLTNLKIDEGKEKITNAKFIISKVFKPKQQINKYDNSKEIDIDINSKEYLERNKRLEINKRRNNTENFDIKINQKADIYINDLGANQDKILFSTTTPKAIKKKKVIKVENYFNIFEILVSQLFKCCICKNVAIKNNIYENANEIINKKLDIITYVRNMIRFDIINQTLLDENRKDIINFLCRPVISVNNTSKDKFDEFYNVYKDKDFEKFAGNIQELIKKPQKMDIDNKLISISKAHLKEFI